MNQNPFDDLTNRATRLRAGSPGATRHSSAAPHSAAPRSNLGRLGRMWMAWFVGGVLGLLASLLVVAGPGATVLSSQDDGGEGVEEGPAEEPGVEEVVEGNDDDSAAVPFTPNVGLGNPGKAFDGTSIDATYRPTRSTGLYDDCTKTKVVTYTYTFDETSGVGEWPVTAVDGVASSEFTLVDIPGEFEGSRVRVRCSYQVFFPSRKERTGQDLLRQSGNGRVISSTSNNLRATFIGDPNDIATFQPIVSINVEPVGAAVGTSFEVGFSPSSGCTEDETETHVMEANGIATRSSGPAVLDKGPENAPCSYAVVWPSVAGLMLVSGQGVRVSQSDSSDNRRASATYQVVAETFEPEISISMALSVAGLRDYTGNDFVVAFTPVSGSEAGCSQSATEKHVGDLGSVARPATEDPTPLVDTPQGSAVSCVYEITWPMWHSQGGRQPRFELQSGYTTRVSAQSRAATASYVPGETRYTPDVEIIVPDSDLNKDGSNDFTGTLFDIVFSSAGGCSTSATQRHIVRSDGSVPVLSTANLVDFPKGSGVSCTYNVTWPDVSRLVKPSNAPGSSSATLGTLRIEYTASLTTFSPEITITVPQVDEDRDGTNDFANTQFVVRIVRTSERSECTESRSEIYVVDDNGTVTLSNAAAELVGLPEGGESLCAYRIEWPTTEDIVGLALGAVSSSHLSVISNRASASYVLPSAMPTDSNDGSGSGDSGTNTEPLATTSPVIRISVPDRDDNGDGNNDFSGTTFNVGFTSDTEDCTPSASETHVVGDDGNVSRQTGSQASLVRSPRGSQADFGCDYSVVWPEVEGLRLGDHIEMLEVAASQAAGEEGDFHLEAEASYRLPAEITLFTPSVSVVVPQVNGADGNNVFSGSRFNVTLERFPGNQWEECTARVVLTLTVNDNGTVTADNEIELVDVYDVGEEDELTCFYKARFSIRDHLDKILRVSPAVVNIDGDRNPVEGRYATNIVPRLVINIPQHDFDNDGVNDYSGSTFNVVFEPVPRSSPGCTQNGRELQQARDDGTVTLEPPPSGLNDLTVLVDVPPGESESARCRYFVIVPPTAAGGTLFLVPAPIAVVGSRLDLATSCVSSIIGCYFPPRSFTPTISIQVPQTEDGQAGVNDWAGTAFTVSFRPIANSDAGCTLTATATVVIEQNGQSRTTSDARLFEHPQFVDSNCRYDIIWPAISGLAVQSSSTAQTDKDAADVTGVYWAAADSTFSPDITIEVPQTEDGQAGVNDWSGTVFSITFNRTGTADGRCTQTATATVEIGDNGRGETTQEAELVNRPIGVDDRCEYDIVWPNDIAGLALQDTSTEQTDDTAREVTGTYRVDSDS